MARNDMMYDGRRLPPRNSRGEFMSRGRGRGRRGDRGMDYGMDGRVIRSYPTIHPQGDYAGDMNYDMARGGRGRGRGDRGDYGDYDMARGDSRSDMRGGDYRGDGHHYPEQMGGQTYYPIEAMGRFNGYWGMPQEDYGRGRDYGYDMMGDYRGGYGRRDYGYDYGYDYGDYGQSLSEKELDHWCKKLMSQLDEREKQMFKKETIMQKAKSMGKPMEDFGEEELYITTLMAYTDYKEVIGANPDMALRLAYAWLSDKDVKATGSQKLAIYYDEIVMGGDD